MTAQSSAELLVLHAIRLLGFANTTAIAARFGSPVDFVEQHLRASEQAGWVEHTAFADLGGWSLTDAGRLENERQLAEERERADPGGITGAVYRDFRPLNARLLRAVTDWQIRPTEADRFAPNTHARNNQAGDDWDRRVLDELAAVGREIAPLGNDLVRVLSRFDGYTARYEAALRRAQNGQPEWVDRSDIDSCHRVWFQLHEDLVATLGIDRLTEH